MASSRKETTHHRPQSTSGFSDAPRSEHCARGGANRSAALKRAPLAAYVGAERGLRAIPVMSKDLQKAPGRTEYLQPLISKHRRNLQGTQACRQAGPRPPPSPKSLTPEIQGIFSCLSGETLRVPTFLGFISLHFPTNQTCNSSLKYVF